MSNKAYDSPYESTVDCLDFNDFNISSVNTNAIANSLNTSDESDFPIRISIMTLNLWGDKLLPDRFESLSQLIVSTKPDILLVQEAVPEVLQLIDTLLSCHRRIKSDYKGWSYESNIYWDSRLFTRTDFGAEPFGLTDYPLRCLFWVRLEVITAPKTKIFCSTVHFPWSGCNEEIETGVNQRIRCCYKVIESLRRLTAVNEAIILGGDFNDDFHPLRILSEEFGLFDVFELLDLPPVITHPVRPSDPIEENRPNRTLDWIVCALPSSARVLGAFAKQIRGGNTSRIPPSDHLPVIALFELTEIKESKKLTRTI